MRRGATPGVGPGRSPIESALIRSSRLLRTARRRWALIGGLAVSARAEPRTTRDVDLAVEARDDDSAERLILTFQAAGFSVESVLEHSESGRLATARLLPPGEETGGVLVDLLFAACGIEPEIAAAATRFEITRGLRVPVASVGHLLAMKTLARDDRERPWDRVDILALLAIATPGDLAEARAAVRLIAQRGFGRGRDLARELELAIG